MACHVKYKMVTQKSVCTETALKRCQVSEFKKPFSPLICYKEVLRDLGMV